jgi:sec-independent protein translocase protein TatC
MSQQNATPDNAFVEQPFVAHLLELRDRLLRALMAIGVIFLCLFPFANDLYTWVASPLMAHLPEGGSMIATEVASPFLTPFKLSLLAAVLLSMPYSLYQLWAFVAPGLYRHEQRLVLPLVVSSTILFYLGMLFAYYVVFPLIFAFFAATTPEGVVMATDIAKYLDFVLTLFFAFGIAFETPIATILLVSMGVTTPESLKEKRPFIIVGAFVVGMMLTPPDVFSQTLLALPIWLLFEAGVFFSRYFVKPENEAEADAEAFAPAPGGNPSAGGGGPSPTGAYAPPAGGSPAFVGVPGDTPFDAQGALDRSRYVPMTPEEMETELDRAADEEARLNAVPAAMNEPLEAPADPIEHKLRQVQAARDAQRESEARRLLYEVLAEGDPDQVRVARNILEQLDN